MSKEAQQLSLVLKELAELKTQQRQTQNSLDYVRRKITSNENAREDWCDAIENECDDGYKPFETENFNKQKSKFLDTVIKKRELEENKPEKKILQDHKIKFIDIISIFIMVVAVISLIMCFVTSWIAAIFLAVALIAEALYLIICKQLIVQIKTHKEIKKQNIASAEFNQNSYPKLIAEYERTLEKYETEYETLRKKVIVAMDECIEKTNEKIEPIVVEELERVTQEIANEKYSIYTIRDYSAEQLNEMADYLASGRADDYKEALNIYIKESAERKRHAEMLEIEKEKAAAEAADREAQQRAQAAHFASMERQAREATEAAQKSAEEAKKQTQIAKAQLDSKCKTCKYYGLYCNQINCRGYERK